MKQRIDNENQLLEALQGLPREMEPPHELWPGIESRLGEREVVSHKRFQAWPVRALAASVVMAFVAGLMFGRQLEGPAPVLEAGNASNLAMLAATEATEREYQAAFREFIPVGSSRTVLKSETIQNIEQTWLELQQAESALTAALQEHPGNSFLNQKLLDLRSQQLGFMQQLATLDQSSWRKT